MLFIGLILFVALICFLAQDHDRHMQEAESLQELYRMEYHHVYPVSN